MPIRARRSIDQRRGDTATGRFITNRLLASTVNECDIVGGADARLSHANTTITGVFNRTCALVIAGSAIGFDAVVRAFARFRIATARQMAGIYRFTNDRFAAGANARLASVIKRAGVAVVASETVFDGRSRATAVDAKADGAVGVEIGAIDLSGRLANARLAAVARRAGVVVVAARSIRDQAKLAGEAAPLIDAIPFLTARIEMRAIDGVRADANAQLTGIVLRAGIAVITRIAVFSGGFSANAALRADTRVAIVVEVRAILLLTGNANARSAGVADRASVAIVAGKPFIGIRNDAFIVIVITGCFLAVRACQFTRAIAVARRRANAAGADIADRTEQAVVARLAVGHCRPSGLRRAGVANLTRAFRIRCAIRIADLADDTIAAFHFMSATAIGVAGVRCAVRALVFHAVVGAGDAQAARLCLASVAAGVDADTGATLADALAVYAKVIHTVFRVAVIASAFFVDGRLDALVCGFVACDIQASRACPAISRFSAGAFT